MTVTLPFLIGLAAGAFAGSFLGAAFGAHAMYSRVEQLKRERDAARARLRALATDDHQEPPR